MGKMCKTKWVGWKAKSKQIRQSKEEVNVKYWMNHGKGRVLRNRVHGDFGRAITANTGAPMHVSCGTCGRDEN
jgi:hypothetical protein